MARVPASEIEFGRQNLYWGDLKGNLDIQVKPVEPDRKVDSPGQPIEVTLRVGNRMGLEVSSPTEFLRVGPDGQPALRRGVAPVVFYAPPLPLAETRWQSRERKTQLEPRRMSHFTPGEASRRLATLESFEAMCLVLNDWYDVSRRGDSQLTFTSSAESGVAEGYSVCWRFTVQGDE